MSKKNKKNKKHTANQNPELFNQNKQNMDQENKEENENSQIKIAPETQENKKNTPWLKIFIFSAFVVGILIIGILYDKKNQKELNKESDNIRTEENELGNGNALGTETENLASNQNKMIPVSKDTYTFTFSKIIWEFSDEADKTNVSFRFADFSRKEGVMAKINNNFKLGFFPGTCTEVDPKSISSKDIKVFELEGVLSLANCKTKDSSELIAIRQNKENKEVVEAFVMANQKNWVKIFEVNITEIIK